MALVLRRIVSLHFYWNEECSDPRVTDWYLMQNPFKMLFILAFYLFFVFKLGPYLMTNRKPFGLEMILRIYNVLQVLLCGWLVFEGFRLGYFFGSYNILCEPVDYSNSKLGMQAAWRAYIYFLIKVVDLLDTVFFVLRKKQNQVTFLHVYHHTGNF